MFSLFSGGKDSVTVAHVLWKKGELEGVVYLDTGITCHDTLPHVKDVCQRFSWPLEVYKTWYSYEELVMKYGFPGKEGSHRWYMEYLKGRAIRLFRKAHPEAVLASGARKRESKRRLGNAKPESLWNGVRIINPLLDWTTEEVWAYVRKNNLPIAPAYEALHISGDCLCGAFADPGELEMMRTFYPEEYSRITALQTRRQAISPKYCTWGGQSQCSQGQCGL